MRYVTLNMLTNRVEQVRDTWEEAGEAAEGDDCLVAWPWPVDGRVASGDSIEHGFFTFEVAEVCNCAHCQGVCAGQFMTLPWTPHCESRDGIKGKVAQKPSH